MKDAKGHGSGGRGRVKISVTRPVGYTIHSVGPGGVKTLEKSGTLSPADHLHSGTSKSDAAPVHEAMSSATHNARGHAWGSPEALKDFSRQYSPNGFSSGAREIAALKRRGK